MVCIHLSRKACVSLTIRAGYRGGGQMVNHLIREWLKKMCPDWTALHDDEQWIRGGVSSQIERCKREFSGRSDHAVWDGYGHEVTIPA